MVRSPNDNVLSVTLSEHCGLLTAQIGLGHAVCVISVGYALFERAAVSRAVPYRRLSVGIQDYGRNTNHLKSRMGPPVYHDSRAFATLISVNGLSRRHSKAAML